MKIRKFSFYILSVAVLFASVAAAQTDPAIRPLSNSTIAAQADERYRIGFQDILDIQIFRHPELSVRASVNPNGTVNLFRLNKPVVAVCKTERELADDIVTAYKVSYLRDPQVTVTVAEQRSQSMSVIGAVEKPNIFFVSRKIHLLELLAMAGGPNKESGTRVVVARTGSTSNCKMPSVGTPNDDDVALMGFKIRDIQEGKKILWMLPGDVVSVLVADSVYVYGNVIKPGEVKFREPITLRQAIASSEGLKPATDRELVRILRQIPDSIERKELVFNLSEIDKGTLTDPYLEPNDIVAVSKDKTKDILIGIGNAVKAGIPSVLARGVPL